MNNINIISILFNQLPEIKIRARRGEKILKTFWHTFPLDLDNLPVSIAAILPIDASISTELPQRLRYVAPRYCQTLAVRHNITYISIVREENATRASFLFLRSYRASVQRVATHERVHTPSASSPPPVIRHPFTRKGVRVKFIGYSAYVSYHLLYAAEYDNHAEF